MLKKNKTNSTIAISLLGAYIKTGVKSMANLTEKSTISISLTKFIAICVAVFSIAMGYGAITDDISKTAKAAEQNTKDIIDLKVINAQVAQILANQQKQLDRLENDTHKE
jgi:hypothetical protein